MFVAAINVPHTRLAPRPLYFRQAAIFRERDERTAENQQDRPDDIESRTGTTLERRVFAYYNSVVLLPHSMHLETEAQSDPPIL
jgi:hypothetical protein